MTEVTLPKLVQQHVWHPEGSVRMFSGRYPVFKHEETGVNAITTPEGTERLCGDEAFATVLGEWAVTVASGRAFSHHNPQRINSMKCIRKSSKGGGYNKISFASVYSPEIDESLVIKAFDYRPRHGIRQFETMQYIASRIQDSDNSTTIKTPIQYALLKAPKHPKSSIVMQKIDGKSRRLIDFDQTPDNIQKTIDYDNKLKDELQLVLGPMYKIFATDVAPQNWLFGRPYGSSDEPAHYIIDQPLGNIIELNRFFLPLGRIARGLLLQ